MPLTDHIAIVSLTREISANNLMQAAAAIQKQVTRDFMPIWGLPATVDAFDDLVSTPPDYHPVVVFGDPQELAGQLEFAIGEQNAAQLVDRFRADLLQGIHLNAFTRQPFALVAATDAWAMTLSHEVLELITDPYGNRLRAAGYPGDANRRVNYLLEVCDPCLSMWYPVNGVPVSDFYTPRYFDPVRVPGGRYSFTGALDRPLGLLDGGYLSWIDPVDTALYQLRAGDQQPVRIADPTELRASSLPLRTVVDSDPRTPKVMAGVTSPAATATSAAGAFRAMIEASEATAIQTAEAVASLSAEFE